MDRNAAKREPAPLAKDRPVVVIGLMGAGKTTLASALAARWGRPLCDSDADLLAKFGRTAAELAQDQGADALHDLEARHLLEALDRPVQAESAAPVVAAAASTIEDATCRAAMGRALVVWIDVPVTELVRRQVSGPHRPVFGPDVTAMLCDMDARRRQSFAEVADIVVGSQACRVVSKELDQTAGEVEALLRAHAIE